MLMAQAVSVMGADQTLTEGDQGKHVISSSGDEIGRIVEVKAGDAYVDPDPDLTDTIQSKLGWGDKKTEDTFRLDASKVHTVTDDEVRVDF